MKTYNVGIIGFGFIGKVHAYGYINLPLFYDSLPFRTKITHVCTSNLDTAEKAKKQLGADFAVTDFKEIVENPDIDIVHICTPNNFHKDALLSAMKYNKHIYCDKPLVVNMAEAEEIRKALSSYKGTAQMTLQNRFFPATIRAKQLIKDDFLGQILEFRACYLHSGNVNPNVPLKWKLSVESGGGVIADLASHVMDIIHYLIGDYQEICARTHIAYPERPLPNDSNKKLKVEVEDSVMMLVKMTNGALGNIEATKIATGTEDEMRFEIHGSKGALRFNGMDAHHLEAYDMTLSDKPFGGKKGWIKIDSGQRYDLPAGFPGPKFGIGWIRSHMQCLYNFLCSVHQKQPGNPGLEQGIYIQHLMECAKKSAKSKNWVNI